MKRSIIILFLFIMAFFDSPLFSQSKTPFDYAAAWKSVEIADGKGLPKTALENVNTIYAKAKADDNEGQLIKALIHQLKYAEYDEEDNTTAKDIDRVEKELGSLPSDKVVVKSLLHSMLGEMYWRYYQNNRWKFSDRTKTVDFEQTDIETWSLEALVEKTFDHYLASCELKTETKSSSLRSTSLELLLNKGNRKGQKIRPTLFDFVAHRALNFFQGDEPEITRPAYAFTLNEESYLSDAENFVKLRLESKDSLSTKFYALKLLKELIQLHLQDKEQDALIDVDLERLDFVKQHSVLPNKAELYLKTLEKLEKKTNASPASSHITYKIALLYQEWGNTYKPLKDETHKWDLKKAYDLCQTAKTRFPDSDGAIECANLQISLQAKSLNAQIEEVNVPNKPFKVLVQYKNFTALNWRVIKVTRTEVEEQRRKWNRNYNVDREEKFLEYFIAKVPVATGKATLPSDGDYQTHGVEVKVEPLPFGEYMVLFSNKLDYSLSGNGLGYAFTTISQLSFINRNKENGATEFYVLDRETGETVPNVKAQLFFREYNSKRGEYEKIKDTVFVTNSEGNLTIPYLMNPDGRRNSFSLAFSKDKDQLYTDKIDEGYETFYQSPHYSTTRSTQTFLFMDRAIYRPGQTIYFKGLSVQLAGKKSTILTKQSISVVLKDVNYQEVARQSFTTNEYGTFNGTFNAPSSGLTGQMSLVCEDGSGTVYFSVEEYKRPKFEVKFEPVKGLMRLGETVKVEGHGIAYSGANIDGAKVRYRIVRKAVFPLWWWYKWSYYPSSPEVEIMNGLTETDAAGNFSVSFQAIADASVDKKSDPTFNYIVYADVTDLNGETHSAETSIQVGYKALTLSSDVQDVDLASKEPVVLHINSTNLAGQFLAAKGEITIHKLKNPDRPFRKRLWEQPDQFLYTKEQFYGFFPADVYADEDNDLKWPKDKQVLSQAFDTEKDKNVALPNLALWETGKYQMEMVAKDPFGEEVREISYFYITNSASKSLSIPKIDHFQSLKTNGEPGSKAKLIVGSSQKVKVLYELEQDGKIILKEWLTLNNEQHLIEITLLEEYRGNIAFNITFVRDGRSYGHSQTISVPYSNKDLEIAFESFRDKLQPGQKEEWKLKIKGKLADKVAAEMVASLYDASLDEFRANNWSASFWGYSYPRLAWTINGSFETASTRVFTKSWSPSSDHYVHSPDFDQFEWFGYNFYGYNSLRFRGGNVKMKKGSMRRDAVEEEAVMMMDAAAPMQSASREMSKEVAPKKLEENKSDGGNSNLPAATKKEVAPAVQPRTNFNETAFFYPNLRTNEKGELSIQFTIPDALTRWKMLGFAHTQDLKSGFVQKELVTQKDLMIVPNQPRFFREGDKMTFSAKVTSLTDVELKGSATLEFRDPLTGQVVSAQLTVDGKNELDAQSFALRPKSSTVVEWQIKIPEGLQAVSYRVIATAGSFSDGEEMTLPVVPNRMMMTETLPLPIRGKQTKTFTFTKLKNNTSTTLKSHKYTLEFTSNPAWYAIQALPYLMEYPYECVEQTFSRYYANSIASHIANSNPRIKKVFDMWKNLQPDALLSNLEKNQELKSALLEETPWVLQAKDESQRKRSVGLLFDLNKMGQELDKAFEKVAKAQTSSGGFSWFPGFPEDRYMTQHIVAGLGHLDAMGIKSIKEDQKTQTLCQKALGYLDSKMLEDYQKLKAAAKRKEIKLEEYQPDYFVIHYLYARSYFGTPTTTNTAQQEAFKYFLQQTKKYWLQNNVYLEGMIALALHRNQDKITTKLIMNSLKERALHSEEMGMYYKQSGYYWHQAPIETQALLIEVFDEVADDSKSVEEMKVWLLKQKQTTDWKTTKATTEACYALLRRGTDVLANTQIPDIQIGSEKIDLNKREDIKVEAGTGYFKTSWTADQIRPDMGEIKIDKKDDGVAWGAVYWQYFELLDKITTAETPLKLKKQLFLQQDSDRGPIISPITGQTALKVGDLVKVRIELRTDRNMEYIHLKDMRAASLEPTTTLSQSKYQDGLWYYESPRDLNTSFFMGFLPKGTYVFEYALRVSQKGDFSNGITTIQCMYAPEFSSHSQGVRILIK